MSLNEREKEGEKQYLAPSEQEYLSRLVKKVARKAIDRDNL